MGRMMINLTGQTFGKLLVLEAAEKWRSGSRVWLCRCECGKELHFSARELKSYPKYTSCGCSNEWHDTQDKQAWRSDINNFEDIGAKCETLNQRYSSYKYAASVRGYEFSISKEEFDYVTKQPCEYCGVTAEENRGFVGVDRKNNEIGYILSNIVPCCEICNKMKMNLSIEVFLRKISKISKRLETSLIR